MYSGKSAIEDDFLLRRGPGPPQRRPRGLGGEDGIAEVADKEVLYDRVQERVTTGIPLNKIYSSDSIVRAEQMIVQSYR